MNNSIEKNQSKKLKPAFVIGLVCIIAAVVVSLGIVAFFACKPDSMISVSANPNHFTLGETLDCNIDESVIKFNEENNTDDLVVNMTVKNILKEAAYDKNARTSDDVSEQELETMSEEERNQINENTKNKFKAQIQSKLDLQTTLSASFFQGSQTLDNVNIDDGTSDYRNYDQIKNDILKSGDSKKVQLAFHLANKDQVLGSYFYSGPLTKEDGTTYSNDDPEFQAALKNIQTTEVVSFDNEGKQTVKLKSSENNSSDSSDAQQKSIQGFNYKLVDGWYVENEAQLATKLKSSNNSNASVDISISSSQNASQQAQSDVTALETSNLPQETIINGKNCFKLEKSEDKWILYYNIPNDLSVRISFTGVKFDNAKPLIDTFSF